MTTAFLPYSGGSTLGWAGAFGASVALHGAVVAGMFGAFGDLFGGAPAEVPPAFTVSFEQVSAEAVTALGEVPAEGTSEVIEETAPEELAPVEPEPIAPEVLMPVAEEPAFNPVLPTESVAVLAPSNAPEVIGATRPEPLPAPPPEVSERTAQDLALAALIERIRAAEADPCLIALPRRSGTSDVSLALIAASDAAMDDFARGFLTAEDAGLAQTRVLIDARQCAALAYIRANADYPATRLGLTFEPAEVASGAETTGIVSGIEGLEVSVLTVDDSGRVEDTSRRTVRSTAGRHLRIELPLTRVGPARDTSLLVIAIATRGAAPQLADRSGLLADAFFAGLPGELADEAALAVATIYVR